jgi:WhiB family redox-sensing transcriptional regulator
MTIAARNQARPAIMRLVEKIVDPGEAWKYRAACRNHPRPTIFHPPPARSASTEQLRRSEAEKRRKIIIAEAKTVCRHCPVIRECEAYAIARDDKYGIWGGKTSKERGYGREDR